MQDLDFVHYATIKPRYVALYSEPIFSKGRPARDHQKWNIPDDNKSHGLISRKAESKIEDSIEYILMLSKKISVIPFTRKPRHHFRIGFVTLTLASKQMHTDNEIKTLLLNQFLIEAKKKWGMRNYLWRAEAQKNGNIHFHILCDKFIPWSELRDTWNRIQNKLGYVNRYRDEMNRFHTGGFKVRTDLLRKWSYKDQIRAWKYGSKNDWNSPNSTDVHSVRHISKLSAYLSKYIAKNQPGRIIDGRLWGCSIKISSLRGAVTLVDNEVDQELGMLRKRFPDKFQQGEYYTVIYIKPQELEAAGAIHLFKLFFSYLNDQFSDDSG